MNVKKNAGGGISENKKMLKSVRYYKNKNLIIEQINIIEPKIIILGLSWEALRNEIFGKEEWTSSGYGIEIKKWNNSKVIDFYHPSSRNAPALEECPVSLW
ncbi:MAG: hypothetical protein ABI723_12950 [Bacteroidia bacterium]